MAKVYKVDSKRYEFKEIDSLTTTSYTLTEDDYNKWIKLKTNDSSIDLQLPNNLSNGFRCILENTGVFTVNYINAVGTTAATQQDKFTEDQYRTIEAAYDNNIWRLQGYIGRQDLNSLYDVNVNINGLPSKGDALVYDIDNNIWTAGKNVPLIPTDPFFADYLITNADHGQVLLFDTTAAPITVSFNLGLDEGIHVRVVNVGTGILTVASAGTLKAADSTLSQWQGMDVLNSGSDIFYGVIFDGLASTPGTGGDASYPAVNTSFSSTRQILSTGGIITSLTLTSSHLVFTATTSAVIRTLSAPTISNQTLLIQNSSPNGSLLRLGEPTIAVQPTNAFQSSTDLNRSTAETVTVAPGMSILLVWNSSTSIWEFVGNYSINVPTSWCPWLTSPGGVTSMTILANTNYIMSFYVDRPLFITELGLAYASNYTGNVKLELYAANSAERFLGFIVGQAFTQSSSNSVFLTVNKALLPGRYFAVLSSSANMNVRALNNPAIHFSQVFNDTGNRAIISNTGTGLSTYSATTGTLAYNAMSIPVNLGVVHPYLFVFLQ